jgi:biotin carboxyl carrier protein
VTIKTWKMPLTFVAVLGLALTAWSTSAGAAASNEPTDGYTPITVTPLEPGTFPFQGSDGKYHVAYDLQLTNASSQPATIDRVDAVDAAHPEKVVVSYSGTKLVDSCVYGDCNRLRYLTSQPVQSTTLGPSESRVLYVDYAFETKSDVPKALLHRVTGTGKAKLGVPGPGPFDQLTTRFSLDAGKPRVISPPLKGDNWVAFSGCCEPGFPHRDQVLPANGQVGNSQLFAIDWLKTNDQGAFYEGDQTKNESYFDYGQPVYAVADATVVSVLDDVDANAPGIQPSQIPAEAAKLDLANADGNHVILNLGGGVYAMYAHFQKGSLLVKPGDKVKKGQKLALLGNTGNANAPHLHFQLMDGPNILTASGLPYVFDQFDYHGQVAVQQVLDADNYVSGTYFGERDATGETRKQQLPLDLAIVNFAK